MRIIFALLLLITLNKKETPFIIVLDPGHGGYDSGAIGYNGVKEKDITLAVALKLKKAIKKITNKKVLVILTRTGDYFVPIKGVDQRAGVAVKLKADLFLSLHLNANASVNGVGLNVFYSNTQKQKNIKNVTKSIVLGALIEKKLVTNLGYKSLGINKANFSVLRNTIENMPSLLIELGFVTNKNELKFITSKGANLISINIAEAILIYMKTINIK